MKYSYSDWNNQSGTIPVNWQKTDYENLNWYRNPDKTKGFHTQDVNYQIYGDRLGVLIPDFPKVDGKLSVPVEVNEIFGYVLDLFDLEDLVFFFQKYEPGMILPWHKDNYPTYAKNMGAEYEDIVRIIVLLHEPCAGQQLWIQDKFCTGQTGSWFSWQGDTAHMAANLSDTDRYVLQLTGKNSKHKKAAG